MQEKFILLWGNLVLLLLPRRYTVMVSLNHITAEHSASSLCTTVWPCVDMCTGGCILSVAVVKNSSLDISSLRGLRSCHSGIRWTAGWSLPLGFLLSRNYLSWSKEHPLSQGSNIIIYSVCIHQFFFAISGSASFQVHSVFIFPGRCQ